MYAFAATPAALPATQAKGRSCCSSAARPRSLSRSSFVTGRERAVADFRPRLRRSGVPKHAAGPSMALGKVVVAGGTGFIGSRLVKALVAKGSEVTVLTRYQSSAGHLPDQVKVQVWAPDKAVAVGSNWVGWEKSMEGADLVVNLCGSPIVTRWDAAGKRSILESRVKTTSAIGDAIVAMPVELRPKCVVGLSAVGYYGMSDSAEFSESSSAAKNDFLADVCTQWEEAATSRLEGLDGTRLVIIRVGVVMGVGGGALARMIPAYKMFVGGPIGRGSQWVSWVHIDDLCNMILTAGEKEGCSGVYNGTAPNPVTMSALGAALARALNRPNLLPVPGIVLKLALGGASAVVLDGQRVLPTHWQADNFDFQYSTIDDAMAAVAKEA